MPAPENTTPPEKAISLKALLAALVAVVMIVAAAGFSIDELRLGSMIGNHMPTAIYTLLFFLVVFWNPFWLKVFPALSFSQKETVTFFVLLLVGCWCANSGLYRYFNRTVIAPVYLEKANPTWKKLGLLEEIPEKLFPLKGDLNAAAPSDAPNGVIPATGDAVYTGFVQGLNIKSQSIKGALFEMSDVLKAWSGPMNYWGSLFAGFFLCILSLSLLFHRQWSKHEQLAYPLAQIASTLIRRDQGRLFSSIFYSKLFWGGFSFAFSIHLFRYFNGWFPQYVPTIATNWHMPWDSIFPIIKEAGFDDVQVGMFIFAAFGISYFTATQLSFSVGFAPILMILIAIQFYGSTGTPLSKDIVGTTQLGAYLGYGIMILWAGRIYYGRAFAGALCLHRIKEDEKDSVAAARFFILSFIATILIMNSMGLDWLIGTLFMSGFLLVFTIMSRVICETGIPFMQPFSGGGIIKSLANMMGPAFFGTRPLVLFNWFTNALAADPRECLMPFASTAIRISDDFKFKLRRIVVVMGVFILIGLAVGFVARSYLHYKFGAQNDIYAWGIAAKSSIQNSVTYVQ